MIYVRAGSGSGTVGYESVNLKQAIAAWQESSNLVRRSVKKLFEVLDGAERHREHADLGEATESRYVEASSRPFFRLTGFLDLTSSLRRGSQTRGMLPLSEELG